MSSPVRVPGSCVSNARSRWSSDARTWSTGVADGLDGTGSDSWRGGCGATDTPYDPTRIGWSVGVQRRVERDARARRAAITSTAPVTELRRNSSPSWPASVAGLRRRRRPAA